MADDPYAILGLGRDADQDAIRKSYRRLAKENHPDLHPGDTAAEERFKAINAANTILSDPERRARFDRGEIDAAGQERHAPPPGYREHAQGAYGARYGGGGGQGGGPGGGAGGWSQEDLGDIFGDMFGGGGRGRARPSGPRRGEDRSYTLAVSFADAALGATRRITLPGGAMLDVKVPPGLEDGQTLRLRGKGGDGVEGGPAGDALIRVSVTPDPRFRRDGNDIHTESFVSVRQAVLGGQIQVDTPAGAVSLTVPPDSDTGQVLRLRGRGIAAHDKQDSGNLYVTLNVRIGSADETLKQFLRAGAAATEGAA